MLRIKIAACFIAILGFASDLNCLGNDNLKTETSLARAVEKFEKMEEMGLLSPETEIIKQHINSLLKEGPMKEISPEDQVQ